MNRGRQLLTLLSIVALLAVASQAVSSAHATTPPLASFCWYPLSMGNQIAISASPSDASINDIDFVFQGKQHSGRKLQETFNTNYSVHSRVVATAERRGYFGEVTLKISLASGGKAVYSEHPVACG